MTKMSYGAEGDLYDFLWLDPDKSVYVLQNKEFAKEKTNYIDLAYLSGLSSGFQDTRGASLNIGRFFTEEWGAEFIYNIYNNKNNDSYDNVRRVNGAVPFMRKLDQSYGLAAIWSPFYGKINTFNKIYYFDLYFGLGVLKLEGNSNSESATNPNSDAFKDEDYVAGLIKVGLKFHLNQRFHLGVEWQSTHYQSYGPIRSQGKSLVSNSDALLKLGILF